MSFRWAAPEASILVVWPESGLEISCLLVCQPTTVYATYGLPRNQICFQEKHRFCGHHLFYVPNDAVVLGTTSQVLQHGSLCNSYASDVYSFGIVVWEVITRKLPWADVPDDDLYRRVVVVKNRPEMPSDAPPSLAKIAQECWAHSSRKRPKMRAIIEQFKIDGWEELR